MTSLRQASHFANQLECLCICGCNKLIIDDILNIVSSFPSCIKLEWELFHAKFADEEDDGEYKNDKNDNRAHNIVRFFTTLMTQENLRRIW